MTILLINQEELNSIVNQFKGGFNQEKFKSAIEPLFSGTPEAFEKIDFAGVEGLETKGMFSRNYSVQDTTTAVLKAFNALKGAGVYIANDIAFDSKEFPNLKVKPAIDIAKQKVAVEVPGKVAEAYNTMLRNHKAKPTEYKIDLENFVKELNKEFGIKDPSKEFKVDDVKIKNLFKGYQSVYGEEFINDKSDKVAKDVTYGESFIAAITYIFRLIGVIQCQSMRSSKLDYQAFLKSQEALVAPIPGTPVTPVR